MADFARIFGASQQSMSKWMKKGGEKPKSAKYINALIEMYGAEVYGVLGLTPPKAPRLLNDHQPPYGLSPLDALPPALRSRVAAALDEINAIYAARHISADSPDAEAIASEVLSRHGFGDISKVK